MLKMFPLTARKLASEGFLHIFVFLKITVMAVLVPPFIT